MSPARLAQELAARFFSIRAAGVILTPFEGAIAFFPTALFPTAVPGVFVFRRRFGIFA